MKIYIILFILFFHFESPAQVNSNASCISVEGIPLPLCQFTRFHTCNSGGPSVCRYARLSWNIRKIDNPSTGLCAGPTTCGPRNCTDTPDGRVCDPPNCQCDDTRPVPTICRQTCDRCIQGTPFVSEVYCEEFCGNPTCPPTIMHEGQILERFTTSTPVCGAPDRCPNGSANPTDPNEISQCPITQPPQPEPFDPAKCCYTGSAPPPYAPNLSPCQAAGASRSRGTSR
jgi:hypothetical protein